MKETAHFRYQHIVDIDFKSILSFIAFVDAGGLYGASLVMGCSPSSVSLHLKKIRCYFRTPLFTREGRNLIPTAYAIGVSEKFKEWFSAFDCICAENKVEFNLCHQGKERSVNLLS